MIDPNVRHGLLLTIPLSVDELLLIISYNTRGWLALTNTPLFLIHDSRAPDNYLAKAWSRNMWVAFQGQAFAKRTFTFFGGELCFFFFFWRGGVGVRMMKHWGSSTTSWQHPPCGRQVSKNWWFLLFMARFVASARPQFSELGRHSMEEGTLSKYEKLAQAWGSYWNWDSKIS